MPAPDPGWHEPNKRQSHPCRGGHIRLPLTSKKKEESVRKTEQLRKFRTGGGRAAQKRGGERGKATQTIWIAKRRVT